MNNEDFMTGYELRLYKRLSKSDADKIKDDKMLENSIKRALSLTLDEKLDTGEVVNIPLKDLLVAKKVAFDLEHPEKIDLKMYAAVLGEDKKSVDINMNNAADLFKGIANPDGESK